MDSLVCVVDTQLLETVLLEDLETVDIEEPQGFVVIWVVHHFLFQGFVEDCDKPLEEVVVDDLHHGVSRDFTHLLRLGVEGLLIEDDSTPKEEASFKACFV